jgi:hypothetical protein
LKNSFDKNGKNSSILSMTLSSAPTAMQLQLHSTAEHHPAEITLKTCLALETAVVPRVPAQPSPEGLFQIVKVGG